MNLEVRTTSRFLLWPNYLSKMKLKFSIFGIVSKRWRKHPALNGLMFHTDLLAFSIPSLTKDHGVDQSTLRKGNSLDAGLMEGFFGMLKREIFYGFKT